MLPEPEPLRIWKHRNKNWKEILNHRAKIGTIVHHRILNKYSPVPLEIPDISIDEYPADALHRAQIAEFMWNELNLDIGYPRSIEELVINRTFRYAGRLDMDAPVDGARTIVDLKTSRAIQHSHELQIAAYWLAKGCQHDQALIVSLHPFDKTNPTLKPLKVYLSSDTLEVLANEFVELVDRWWEKNGK